MAEFWEENFRDKHTMWGEDAAPAATIACTYFKASGVKSVLIPGIGYGRNAVPFLDAGMKVVGIEISETAINIAKAERGITSTIYHGSVTDMPFDGEEYDGIFCYAVIHLLDKDARGKLIADCYNQLARGGVMIFVAVSTKAPNYARGTAISPNRFEQHGGVKIYFYDEAAIKEEFSEYGVKEIREVTERGMPFFMVVCTKE